MQSTHTNQLETANTIAELEARIPPKHRGPTFQVGEVVALKGYGYRIHALAEGEILLVPHGPIKPGRRLARGKRPKP